MPRPNQILIDLSMPITDHWRFRPSISHRSADAYGQPFHNTDLAMGAHGFTHVDAPSHVLSDGTPLGEVDLGRLWGEAAIIDVSALGDNAQLSAEDFDRLGHAVSDGDIVLIRSNHELRHPTTEPEFWTRSPWLNASAARWLRDRSVRAVGYDFPQDRGIRAAYIDDFDVHAEGQPEDWACHHFLLEAGIVQIEYLTNLWSIPGDRVEFYALPMNIPQSDGAPTRAFAIAPASSGV